MFEYESGVGVCVPGFFDYSYDDFIMGGLYDLEVFYRQILEDCLEVAEECEGTVTVKKVFIGSSYGRKQ